MDKSEGFGSSKIVCSYEKHSEYASIFFVIHGKSYSFPLYFKDDVSDATRYENFKDYFSDGRIFDSFNYLKKTKNGIEAAPPEEEKITTPSEKKEGDYYPSDKEAIQILQNMRKELGKPKTGSVK